jgi:predicted Rossmann fold flavoprotein
MILDIVVVGGGAAGLMAAGYAAELGARVCLVEKMERPGKKLSITGKGRCNVTNNCSRDVCIESVPGNGRFLYGAFSAFSCQDTMAFFEGRGLPLKTERGARVFPVSDKARDVVDTLIRYVEGNGAVFHRGRAVSLFVEDGVLRGVCLENGEKLLAQRVILACGGASYPGTGSNGDGYRLAQEAGHRIVPLKPSLVPLVAAGTDCRDMMGLSLRNIGISVWDTDKKKEVYKDFGELLFTHFGLSGPVILSASSHMRNMSPGRYRVDIDLKPALRPEQLDARLQRDFSQNLNRDFLNSLSALLPRKLIPVAVKRSGIPGGKKCNSITREERLRFGRLLKAFSFEITGFRPIEEAIVTSGGVDVRQVSPHTMESKLLPGLYFAGEMLDVDAYTGGFNLQIAFSTGRAAAAGAVESLSGLTKNK